MRGLHEILVELSDALAELGIEDAKILWLVAEAKRRIGELACAHVQALQSESVVDDDDSATEPEQQRTTTAERHAKEKANLHRVGCKPEGQASLTVRTAFDVMVIK